MRNTKRFAFVSAFSAFIFLAACADEGTTENITQVTKSGVEVVSAAEELPECTKENEGDQAWIRGETSARICVDGKWFATLDIAGNDFKCTTAELKDKSGIKIICNGDSVGVVKNGKDATSIVDVDRTVLDSEKVATSLEGVYGFSQKGPFLMGSDVKIIELESGRTLNQTGFSFDAKIQSDDGQFKLNARMMASQYLELHVEGYYRNEVTGSNSDAPLTLYAITDVMMRSGGLVNINLLTHLEYHRVLYLVKTEKLRVSAAKEQAQREVLALLDVNGTGFNSSEDLNIAGSSDEDGALLAFSVMFQGDRSVASLTELLSKVSADLEKDGKWSDSKTRMKIAEWSADADSAGRLDTIRKHVENWKLSQKVPDFEKYVRNFWYKEYGLDSCTTKNKGEVKAATAGKRKGTKTRYICKADSKDNLRWVIASDLEKDTHDWNDTTDGALKNGSLTEKKYVFDKTGSYNGTKGWREAVNIENVYGGCREAIFDSIRSYRGTNGTGYYLCQRSTHKWVLTNDNLMIDTQGWAVGTDGLSKWGDSIGVVPVTTGNRICYVYDTSAAYSGWRTGNDNDCTLEFGGCTKGHEGEMALNTAEDVYFVCDADMWRQANTTEEIACRNKGVCRLCSESSQGLTEEQNGIMYICDKKNWREFNCAEKQRGVCTANDSSLVEACENVGEFYVDYICSDDHWHAVTNPFEYTLAAWNAKRDVYNEAAVMAQAHSDSMITDPRDNKMYRTIIAWGNVRIFAENLRYADSSAMVNLKGQTWCYNNEAKNCEIGGRYYSWTAAVNLNKQWRSNKAESLIKTQHQGVCPVGWHVPTLSELSSYFSNYDYRSDYAKLQMVGFGDWAMATDASGFSVLPVGYYDVGIYEEAGFTYVGMYAYFWTTSEYSGDRSYCKLLTNGYMGGQWDDYTYKNQGYTVRCIQNYPETYP